jgi:hypothetical protein
MKDFEEIHHNADGMGRKWSPMLWVCVFVAVLVVVAAISMIIEGAKKSPEERRAHQQARQALWDRSKAPVMARSFVQQKLKSARSPRFAPPVETVIVDLQGGRWSVSGWVDSWDSLGALLRNDYTVQMHKTGQEGWQVDEVKLSPR